MAQAVVHQTRVDRGGADSEWLKRGPQAKLRADLGYIRRQSLSFDVKIVLRQVWNVWTDVVGVVTQSEEDEEAIVEGESEPEDSEAEREPGQLVGQVQD